MLVLAGFVDCKGNRKIFYEVVLNVSDLNITFGSPLHGNPSIGTTSIHSYIHIYREKDRQRGERETGRQTKRRQRQTDKEKRLRQKRERLTDILRER